MKRAVSPKPRLYSRKPWTVSRVKRITVFRDQADGLAFFEIEHCSGVTISWLITHSPTGKGFHAEPCCPSFDGGCWKVELASVEPSELKVWADAVLRNLANTLTDFSALKGHCYPAP